jgi:hypothetical protein
LETEQTSDLIIGKIRQIFPRENPADVLRILEFYGTDGGEKETERVRLAVLKLCGGDLSELHELTVAAKKDYRDVLAWAEFSNQVRISFAEFAALPPDTAKEICELDRHQYLAWLRSEK